MQDILQMDETVCMIHRLQTCIEHLSNSSMTTIKNAAESLIKAIRSNAIMRQKLRQLQEDDGIPEQKISKLILDVVTRWDSEFLMLKQLLKLLPYLNKLLDSHSHLFTGTLNWPKKFSGLLKELVETYSPIFEVTRKLNEGGILKYFTNKNLKF